MKIRVESTPESLAALQEWVESWWSSEWGAEESRYTLELVLEELFQNSLNHGQCDWMEVECSAGAEAIVLLWKDNGVAFDSSAAKESELDLPLQDRPLGGAGLTMIHEMAQQLSYQRTLQGNELRCLLPRLD